MFATLIFGIVSIYVSAYPGDYMDKRIIDGTPSLSSSWPMMVSIHQRNLQDTLKWMNIPFTSENGQFCAGTLINSEWVVTAASCFPDRDVQKLLNGGNFNYLKVRRLIWLMRTLVRRMNLSDYRICLDESCSRWSPISNIIIHPGYLISVGKNSPGFDIALVKLTQSAGEFIPNLVSNPDSFNVNQSLICKTAGWGVQNVKERLNSGEFREFDVSLVDTNLCKPFIKKLELCGIGELKENTRSDFCFFDSGGPLLCRETTTYGVWQLVGLISRGTKEVCGDLDQRGIYTDVSAYVNWIDSVMQRN